MVATHRVDTQGGVCVRERDRQAGRQTGRLVLPSFLGPDQAHLSLPPPTLGGLGGKATLLPRLAGLGEEGPGRPGLVLVDSAWAATLNLGHFSPVH